MKRQKRERWMHWMCAIMVILFAVLAACGGKGNDLSIPSLESHFKGCEIEDSSVHSDVVSMDRFDITCKDAEKLEELYRSYIQKCEGGSVWVNKKFVNDVSWCYQNKDKTKQLTVNLEHGSVVVSIKEVD